MYTLFILKLGISMYFDNKFFCGLKVKLNKTILLDYTADNYNCAKIKKIKQCKNIFTDKIVQKLLY